MMIAPRPLALTPDRTSRRALLGLAAIGPTSIRRSDGALVAVLTVAMAAIPPSGPRASVGARLAAVRDLLDLGLPLQFVVEPIAPAPAIVPARVSAGARDEAAVVADGQPARRAASAAWGGPPPPVRVQLVVCQQADGATTGATAAGRDREQQAEHSRRCERASAALAPTGVAATRLTGGDLAHLLYRCLRPRRAAWRPLPAIEERPTDAA
jgi:hypothetical protein